VQEIVPGIHHWAARHPRIKIEVSSYWIEPARVLLDPILPEDGDLGTLAHAERRPEQIILTNRHHYRHCDEFRAALGEIPVRAVRSGMHEFEEGPEVEPFDFGDEPAPGVTAIEIGGICPDDTALHIDVAGGAVAFADGLVRMPQAAPLGFVPDELMGEPERDKQALRRSLRRVLDGHDFEHLLLAHGRPVVGGGPDALREFLEAT
jgi:hypothetical protein